MSSQNQIMTPQSQTGLMRFSDVSSSSIQLDPKIIMVVCGIVIALEIIFHTV
ncbi:preprotein translocase subunit Sec61beta [Candidatus Micrarchaeota archaeon]|nr:preprotein translocase subunit Sec61beta [Candidatus Micrarchaeota archaeon]